MQFRVWAIKSAVKRLPLYVQVSLLAGWPPHARFGLVLQNTVLQSALLLAESDSLKLLCIARLQLGLPLDSVCNKPMPRPRHALVLSTTVCLTTCVLSTLWC